MSNANWPVNYTVSHLDAAKAWTTGFSTSTPTAHFNARLGASADVFIKSTGNIIFAHDVGGGGFYTINGTVDLPAPFVPASDQIIPIGIGQDDSGGGAGVDIGMCILVHGHTSLTPGHLEIMRITAGQPAGFLRGVLATSVTVPPFTVGYNCNLT